MTKVLNLSITLIFSLTTILWVNPPDSKAVLENSTLRPSPAAFSEVPLEIGGVLRSSSAGQIVIPQPLADSKYEIYNAQLDIAKGLLNQGKEAEAKSILEQARLLLDVHFFETELPTFEAIRVKTRNASSVEEVNIAGPIKIESPPAPDPTGKRGPIDIIHMEESQLAAYIESGSKIRSDFGFSAGGLTIRTKGIMNVGFAFAIPELNPGNPDQLYGFIELKIAEAKRSQDELKKATGNDDARVKVYIMGSGGSMELIRDILQRNNYYGYNPSDIEIFCQGLQLRFTPSAGILDGYLAEQKGKVSADKLAALQRGINIQKRQIGKPVRLSDGRLVITPPGHWDFVRWLILRGILAQLKRDGIQIIMHANMNNIAARLSPELKGLFLERIEQAKKDNEPIPVAMVCTAENRGERGGFLVEETDLTTNEAKLIILDRPNMPKEFLKRTDKKSMSDEQLKQKFPYFHTATILLLVKGLMQAFNLDDDYNSKLSLEEIAKRVSAKEPDAYISLKESEDVDENGRPVIFVGAQIERDIAALTRKLPYVPVVIDRDKGFVPIKEMVEVDPLTETGRKMLGWAATALRDRLPYLFDEVEFGDNVTRISNVVSRLLGKDVSKMDEAFAKNVSMPRRNAVRDFLLNVNNAGLLQVMLGIRLAVIQIEFKANNIYDRKGDLTDFGKDFLYFLRVLGYKTGKKINIKRIETPAGPSYYIYDEDILRYYGYINGYPPQDYINLKAALEDFLIVSEVAREKGLFYSLATEPRPEYMTAAAEELLEGSKNSIREARTTPLKRDITLAPLWIPSYKRPMGLYRVLELQTKVLDEFGHKGIPIAVASNADPRQAAEAMKDPEVDWINQAYFNGKKTRDEIRTMKWGELDRLVVQTFRDNGYNIVYINWDVRDAIVEKVINELTARYTSLYEAGKLREDIRSQFKDKDSIRATLKRILKDQFASNISGIRNFTIMLAQGQRMVSVDDDSLPVMKVAKRRVLEKILEGRRQEVEKKRKEFFAKLSEVSGKVIKSEADFFEYLAKNAPLPAGIEDVIREYYAYTPDRQTALIPEAAGEIVSPAIDTTTRFDTLLNAGTPERLIVSEDAILPDVDDKDSYQYDEYTVDYISVLNRALSSYVVSPNTGAKIVDKDKRGFAGSAFTGNIDDIRFLRNQSATTHFNHDRDKSGDAQIDSFLKRGALDPLTLQEAAVKAIFLTRPEGVTALLDPQEDTALSKRIFMCMNMFGFDSSVYPIPTIGQLLRIEEPYFNYLGRAVTGRLMTWTRSVGGHHRIQAGTRPNIPLQVCKEHTAMVAWPVLNRVVRETILKFENAPKYDDRINYRERMMYLGRRMIEEAGAYKLPDARRTALLEVQSKTIERINGLTKKAADALSNGNEQLSKSLNMLVGEFVVEFLPPPTIVEVQGKPTLKIYPVETTYLMEVDEKGDTVTFSSVSIIEDMVGDEKQKEDRVVSFEINKGKQPVAIDAERIVTTDGGQRYSVTLSDGTGTEIVFDKKPQAGEKRYVSGINETIKKAFIEKIVADIRQQMKSDGGTLLFWPDVIEVAVKTEDFQRATQSFSGVKSATAGADNTVELPEIEQSVPGIKSSSAGSERQEIERLTSEVNGLGSGFILTDAPMLDINRLNRFISELNNVKTKLGFLKLQSPEATIVAAGPLKKTEAFLKVVSLSKDIAAEEAKIAEEAGIIGTIGTIIINDAEIPANQKILLTLLDKENSYLKALEEKLGCKVRLLSQFNPAKDRSANMIAISREKIESIHSLVRYIDVSTITEEAYLPLEQIIVLAKGLLVYNIDKSHPVQTAISQLYRLLTKTPMKAELLISFLEPSGVFRLELPAPVPVDEKYYQDLHKQAMAALIAA